MGKTLKIENYAKELKELTSRSVEDQKKAVTAGVMRSLPELVAASPVDTGLYAASWDFTQDEVSATLGNYAPHAPIIEDGARPFTPPLAPLLAWAKRVLKDSSQPPDYSPKVWALARGVQNKISREGIKPKHILRDMLPKILENIKQELSKLG
jgi:hypothetical protein